MHQGTAGLLARAQRGDTEATERLLRRAARLVWKSAQRVPPQWRQDTEQELYVRILEAIKRFRVTA